MKKFKSLTTSILSTAIVCLISTIGFSTWFIFKDPTIPTSQDFGNGAIDFVDTTTSDKVKSVSYSYDETNQQLKFAFPLSINKAKLKSLYKSNMTNQTTKESVKVLFSWEKKDKTVDNDPLTNYVSMFDEGNWRKDDQPHLFVQSLNENIYTTYSTNLLSGGGLKSSFYYNRIYSPIIPDSEATSIDWTKINFPYTKTNPGSYAWDYNEDGSAIHLNTGLNNAVRVTKGINGTTIGLYFEVHTKNSKGATYLYKNWAYVYSVKTLKSLSSFKINRKADKNTPDTISFTVNYINTSGLEKTEIKTFSVAYESTPFIYNNLSTSKTSEKIITNTSTCYLEYDFFNVNVFVEGGYWKFKVFYKFKDYISISETGNTSTGIKSSDYNFSRWYFYNKNRQIDPNKIRFEFLKKTDSSLKTYDYTQWNRYPNQFLCDYFDRTYETTFNCVYNVAFTIKSGKTYSQVKEKLKSYLFRFNVEEISEGRNE